MGNILFWQGKLNYKHVYIQLYIKLIFMVSTSEWNWENDEKSATSGKNLDNLDFCI